MANIRAPPPTSDVLLPPANVVGVSPESTGVRGVSTSGTGVQGFSTSGDGVFGQSTTGIAIHGTGSKAGQFEGAVTITDSLSVDASLAVKGDINASGAMTVSGNINASGAMTVSGNINAGGNIAVTGDVTFTGGDCAEEIDAALDIEPGSVVVVDDSGRVQECDDAYDKRVVGIISGAGAQKPAIILGKKQDNVHSAPLALSGMVFCRVDAEYAPIEVGDLLTTSPTPGHAMRALDPARSFGCVIGKAIGRLDSGRGLVPVLVSLQ